MGKLVMNGQIITPIIKREFEHPCLCFTAVQGNTTISVSSYTALNINLQYSFDGTTWTQWPTISSETNITFTNLSLTNAGDKLYVKGYNTTMATYTDTYSRFVITGGLVEVSGDVSSLILKNGETLPSYCFCKLFQNCTNIVTPPELHYIALSNNCYAYMFDGCSRLEYMPLLPAPILATNCYQYMFQNCIALRHNIYLPATTLAAACYYYMFYGCTKIDVGPVLPATTLAQGCYYYMFANCTELKSPSALPATTLASNCYSSMFRGCTNLTVGPELPATTLAPGCYNSMFYGCSRLGRIRVRATTWNTSNASNWVNGVSSTGDFYCPSSLSIGTGVSAMPSGWTRRAI